MDSKGIRDILLLDEKDKNDLLKEYFCAVVPDDVIRITKTGKVYLGNKEISKGELLSLRQEAEYFKASRLASILWNSLYDQACKIMFEKAENFDDMRNGKMMMYNVSTQKRIVDTIINAH